jgi:hypothetical protein
MPARAAAAVVGGLGFLILGAVPAFAPHVAQLQVTPSQVKPGDEVTVYGPRGYGRTNPVEIRWDSPNGPVLGTFNPNTESYAQFGPGTVRIPADVRPGTYELWATQVLTPGETYIRGVPARATLQVTGPGGPPAIGEANAPGPEPVQVGLERTERVSGGRLAIIGFGVAGIALFLGGAAAIIASRRSRSEPAAERVTR